MYNDPMVKMTFVVPQSVKERLKRYSKYHNFSMTDVFRVLVNELQIDPYSTPHKEVEHASAKTHQFLGEKSDSKGFWAKLHLT